MDSLVYLSFRWVESVGEIDVHPVATFCPCVRQCIWIRFSVFEGAKLILG